MITAVANKAITLFICSLSSKVKPTIAGVINKPTKFITLINGFMAGPAVSLNGSPTVSPTTVAL
ncbi:unannotated protein [freshwater metagenome]|uniref:Unannotated protein n=1 Tax=freshwater metagenome TaxID=449393 RepID=A0A6J6DXM2_9ZZZZ